GADIEVEGVIEQLPQLLPGARRFVFDVERTLTRGAHVPATISLAWYADGDADAAALAAGDRWRFTVRLKRPRGVIAALAIGDQDSIAPDDWEVFWRTGVGHLMSISGLHITMVGALAAMAAYFAWVRVPWLALAWPARKAAAVAGVAAALGYCLMTGYAVPAQRTVVMLAAVAACVLVDRHGSPSRVLALAALAVLATDPWAAISPGFWMSFGAVAAILYAMGLRAGREGRLAAALAEQA